MVPPNGSRNEASEADFLGPLVKKVPINQLVYLDF